MSVLFDDLPARVIPKMQQLLNARAEPYAVGVTVANQVIPGKTRMVTIVQGPSSGTLDTLDDTTLRVNVRADDEGDAADLTFLVRALIEAHGPLGLRDGKPIVNASISAGPVPVENDTDLFQWYMVANVTRRGTQFT